MVVIIVITIIIIIIIIIIIVKQLMIKHIPASENAHIHIQIRRKHVWQTLKTINKNNVTFEKALFNKGVAIDVHN